MNSDGKIEQFGALVRPVVTLMFSAALVWGFVVHLVSTDAFLGTAGLTIGFWFQQRGAKETTADAVKLRAIDNTKGTTP